MLARVYVADLSRDDLLLKAVPALHRLRERLFYIVSNGPVTKTRCLGSPLNFLWMCHLQKPVTS